MFSVSGDNKLIHSRASRDVTTFHLRGKDRQLIGNVQKSRRFSDLLKRLPNESIHSEIDALNYRRSPTPWPITHRFNNNNNKKASFVIPRAWVETCSTPNLDDFFLSSPLTRATPEQLLLPFPRLDRWLVEEMHIYKLVWWW